MKQYILIIVMSFLAGSMAARATDRYEVHLLHSNGLQVVRVMSPDGTVSNNITSLSVKKGDQITFIIDNAFTPLWKYSNVVTDVPFRLPEMEANALKDVRSLVRSLSSQSGLRGKGDVYNLFHYDEQHTVDTLQKNGRMDSIDSLRARVDSLDHLVQGLLYHSAVKVEDSRIEDIWLRLLARADSLPIVRSAYDARRERGELGLSHAFYTEARSMYQRTRDTLGLLRANIDTSAELADRAELYKWITRLFTEHMNELESQVNATTGPSRWTVEAKSDEQVVVLYARNRVDTTRFDSLELHLNVSYPRPAFSLDPTLAVLILQNGRYDYSVKTDSTGTASLADTTVSTGVFIRPAVQFTWWPAVFGTFSNWAFGPSVYFGYAHDFVFDIGATFSLAYRDVAQLSMGYVSASIPQSVSGQINADAAIPENAILNYRRVGSMVICLSIQGLAL